MFACALYPTEDNFMDSVREEVAYQVHFRHSKNKINTEVSVLPLLSLLFLFVLSLNSMKNHSQGIDSLVGSTQCHGFNDVYMLMTFIFYSWP